MLHSVVLLRKGTADDTEAFNGKKSVPPDVTMEWKYFSSVITFCSSK